MEENNQQNIPLLCRNGCGYYGSPNFDGLCSKCHRDMNSQCSKDQQSGRISPLEPLLCSSDSRKQTMSSVESLTKCESPITVSNKSTKVERVSPTCDVDSSPTSKQQEKDLTKLSTSTSQAELQADAEVAASGLTDSLSHIRSDDSKPSSPASTGSSTNTGGNRRNRCARCRKAVGLTGFICRCGGVYCCQHRYSDKHDCSFDYRESGQDEIRRSNPKIVCQKVQKI